MPCLCTLLNVTNVCIVSILKSNTSILVEMVSNLMKVVIVSMLFISANVHVRVVKV